MPETLPYQITLNCPIGADVRHLYNPAPRLPPIGARKAALAEFIEWFKETKAPTEKSDVTKSAMMSDIAKLLDPDTRAELRKAFIEMQRLAEMMSLMADARMSMLADLASKKG